MIGIFDSGVGGLTVAKEILSQLPQEDIVYFGDTARVPYGSKSTETIRRFASEDARFLIKQNIKIMVVACHTVSAVGLSALNEEFGIPIVGVISPGARAAVRATRNNRVGVIGTQAVIESDAYAGAIKTLNPELGVFSQACPLFVPLVEEGWLAKPATRLIAREYLEPLIDENVDTLILGCTHYPLLKKILSEAMGNGVRLVDPAYQIALEVRDLLARKNLLCREERTPTHRFFVSDAPDKFKEVGEMFLGKEISQIQRVDIF
jgi:glutamate racemase